MFKKPQKWQEMCSFQCFLKFLSFGPNFSRPNCQIRIQWSTFFCFFLSHMTQFKTQRRNNKLTPYFTTALNNYIICTSKYVLQKQTQRQYKRKTTLRQDIFLHENQNTFRWASEIKRIRLVQLHIQKGVFPILNIAKDLTKQKGPQVCWVWFLSNCHSWVGNSSP